MSSNDFDPEFLELVVREVIRRLRDQGLAVQTSDRTATEELVLPERLVTQATLHGRLDGVRRLVVNPRAVVTPAVRDELKDQQIELVRR